MVDIQDPSFEFGREYTIDEFATRIRIWLQDDTLSAQTIESLKNRLDWANCLLEGTTITWRLDPDQIARPTANVKFLTGR